MRERRWRQRRPYHGNCILCWVNTTTYLSPGADLHNSAAIDLILSPPRSLSLWVLLHLALLLLRSRESLLLLGCRPFNLDHLGSIGHTLYQFMGYGGGGR